MVKIIPQEKEVVEKESILVVLLFWFSLFIFIVVTSLFFVFHWQTKKAEAELEKTKRAIEQVGTVQQRKLEESFFDFKRKIDDFPIILNAHKMPSRIFGLLEENIHPEVWFSSLRFLGEKNQILLSGKAKTFLALSQQIFIFEKLPEIKELTLSGAGVDKDGEIKFDLTLTITPAFLSIQK